MTEGGMLKKITEAMKDLVTEANFDCSSRMWLTFLFNRRTLDINDCTSGSIG